MGIDEYLAKNGITLQIVDDIRDEHRRVNAIRNNPGLFYREAARTGFDDFMDSAEFNLNRTLFEFLKNESRKFSDVFEPCCQSGLLGCFIAGGFNGSYKGVDVNNIGIDKAKKRAAFNGLNPEIFVCDNVLTYNGRHEAVVGRYAINTDYLNPDYHTIDALCRISNNIIMVVKTQPEMGKHMADLYKRIFEKRGFNSEVAGEIMESPAPAEVFSLRAGKRK